MPSASEIYRQEEEREELLRKMKSIPEKTVVIEAPASAPLPTDPQARKSVPLCTGVLDYFPLALIEVAKCSAAGNAQHHPDKPLHWDKTKSTDHADCLLRHWVERDELDTDGILHAAKAAWRSLAYLQTLLERKLNEPQE